MTLARTPIANAPADVENWDKAAISERVRDCQVSAKSVIRIKFITHHQNKNLITLSEGRHAMLGLLVMALAFLMKITN